MLKETGQSTVEYALISAAFLALIIGLGFLWRSVASGEFEDHAVLSASHHIQSSAVGGCVDVLLY